jgi:hypothetical protein
VVYLSDETCREELLDFFMDGLSLIVVKAPQLLFKRLGAQLDVELVLGDIPWDAWHVGGLPSEHIEIRLQEKDECLFLLRAERRANVEHTTIVGYGYLFGVFGGLERACRPLGGFQDIEYHESWFRSKLVGVDERVCEVKTLGVTLVSMLELGVNGDHPLRPGHFQLEVGEVEDRHELGVRWPSEDRVIRSREADHLKGERLLAEVPSVPKVTGRSICLSETSSIPGTTPWNGVNDGRSWDRWIPMHMKMMLRSLPPSMSTLCTHLVPNYGSTMRG